MIIIVVFWLNKYIFFWWNSWMSCKESSLRNYGTTKTFQNVVNTALPTLCLVAFPEPACRLKARLFPLSGTESDHPVTSYQRLAPSLIEGSAALCVVAAALESGATISSGTWVGVSENNPRFEIPPCAGSKHVRPVIWRCSSSAACITLSGY